MREAAFLVDEHARFRYVNAESCRLLGYTGEELLGKSVLEVVPEEQWPQHWSNLKAQRSFSFEREVRTKDGNAIPIEVSASYFEYGGNAYNLALVRDISERKQAEEVRLEARVAERTRIARELHDTLLQSFQGLLPLFQAAIHRLPENPVDARKRLEVAIDRASEAITEGRDAVQALRMPTVEKIDIAVAIRKLGEELGSAETTLHPPTFRVVVEGTSRNVDPILRNELYQVAAEALRNAFRHAAAQCVEVELRYDERFFQR